MQAKILELLRSTGTHLTKNQIRVALRCSGSRASACVDAMAKAGALEIAGFTPRGGAEYKAAPNAMRAIASVNVAVAAAEHARAERVHSNIRRRLDGAVARVRVAEIEAAELMAAEETAFSALKEAAEALTQARADREVRTSADVSGPPSPRG
jgi:hypothetical protein